MLSPRILFADTRFVVLDKPAGLPVHAGPRGGISVEDWFPQLSRRRDGPWLAHRLDADTAGCLVVALRKAALLEAQAAFMAGTVRKTYWAVVRGGPGADTGLVEAPLLRRTGPAGWRMEVDRAGSPAADAVAGAGADGGHELDGAAAADRTDPPDPRALCDAGMPGPGRPRLRRRRRPAAPSRAGRKPARAAGGGRNGAGPGAHGSGDGALQRPVRMRSTSSLTDGMNPLE